MPYSENFPSGTPNIAPPPFNTTRRYNVFSFGAKGDGVADDTVAIQAAINAAQQFVPATNTFSPQSPMVYIPAGKYVLTATLLVTKPILIMGDGPEQTQLLARTVNAPCINIAPTTTQSTYITYDVSGLQIVGNNPLSYVTRDLADGICVASSANDITARIRNNRVIGMTGNGIAIYNMGNSCKIEDNITEGCCEAGILATTTNTAGSFNTNLLISGNYSRQNRRGIYLKGFSPNGIINSGRVLNNLCESNNGGVNGTVQTADRPSVGLQMDYCTGILVQGNYFENHCNDLLMAQPCFYNRVIGNYWMQASAFELPKAVVSGGYGGPPQFQLGIFINNGFGNLFEGNLYGAYPNKPADVLDADWGTGTFGTNYPYVTDTLGGEIFRDEMGLGGNPSHNPPYIWITNPNNFHVITYTDADAGRAIYYNLTSHYFNVTRGKVGIGGNTATNTWLNIIGQMTAGVTQIGAIVNPTMGSDATTQGAGIQILVQTMVASFVMAAAIGLHISDAVKGTGSSITTQYGILIDNLAAGGTNYAIKTGAGLVQFGDKFACNGSTPQAAAASGGALAGYVTGAFGLDSNAHMQALFNLVVAIRAALVANGIMS